MILPPHKAWGWSTFLFLAHARVVSHFKPHLPYLPSPLLSIVFAHAVPCLNLFRGNPSDPLH